jgi:glyoxylate/hydroxypyruvate reductase
VQNGYRVSAWSLNAATLEGVQTAHGDNALRQVLSAANIVVNLLPLTAATRSILNAHTFAQMRPDARLVNLARGAHVVDADLLAALNSGRLKRAVLDAFHTEPLPTDHPFWTHPQVTVLPHVAAQTDPRSAVEVVARNVIAHRTGGQKQYLVNRQAGY